LSYSVSYLNSLRRAEIEAVIALLPDPGMLLEIGAGTGEQAVALTRAGWTVHAVDLAASMHSSHRIFPIQDYDGIRLPYSNNTFDAVLSSNVLDQVHKLDELQAEIDRVLKPNGICVHVVPTSSWRCWTTIAGLLKPIASLATLICALSGWTDAGSRSYWGAVHSSFNSTLRAGFKAVVQRRLGERGNVITEVWFFSAAYRRIQFNRYGFRLIASQPLGLFYTGHGLIGERSTIKQRLKAARYLGSSARICIMRCKEA
jgi:SAM-dependent methyltransferase